MRTGTRIERGAVPPDADGLRGLAGRVGVYEEPVRAAIESMNGARFVHDRLEELGWDVLIAEAQKVKGLAPLASKTDRIDAWVLPASAVPALPHRLPLSHPREPARVLGRPVHEGRRHTEVPVPHRHLNGDP